MKRSLQELLSKLKSLFPEAVTESERRDADGKPYYTYALKEEFIEQLKEGGLDIADDQQNRYELQFPGKHAAKALAYLPSYKTLVADRGQSKRFDETGNLFIEGDNLDVLRMLQKSYRGRIKMIYIDPPYNTGGDDFIYNDDLSVPQREYLKAAGILDEDGVRKIDELRNGLRGRFHASWLAMIYPRLKLARELLSEDGVIFISIDDNELANLKLICDEIFGEERFVGQWNWYKSKTPPNLSKKIKKNIEYILCYEKQNIDYKYKGLIKKSKSDDPFINSTNSIKELCFPAQSINMNREFRKGVYGTEKYPSELLDDLFLLNGKNKNRVRFRNKFRWTQGKLDSELERGTIINLSNNGVLSYKKIEYDPEVPPNFISAEVGNTNENAGREMKNLMDSSVFDYPKPTELIKYLANFICGKNDLILDFFAGSATTAHAVMQLNAEDGGKRRFIMAQWAEKIDPQRSKEAHSFCAEKLRRPATIAEIAKERIRRAGAKIGADHPDRQIDDGFRVFTVQDSLISSANLQRFDQTGQGQLDAFITNLAKEKFEPLLYEALLQTGAALDAPLALHEIEGYPLAICERRCYCVTENLTQPIVRQIAEQLGDQFDMLYYLSDCPAPTTSYTELRSAIQLASGDKGIEALNFY